MSAAPPSGSRSRVWLPVAGAALTIALLYLTIFALPPLIAQFVHVGYAALQSGDQTTWIELDLTPGTYAAICFIVDPHTGRPHVLDRMVTVFAVR